MDRGPSGAAPTRYRPKPGGGFAEDYDLRLYHPGDNLRQIHWKMSAKTGKKILREPIEPVRRKTVVTLVLSGDDAAMDRKLGRLQWLGDALSKEQTEFELHTITGSGPEVWQVTGSKAFHEAMAALLFRTPAPEGAAVTLPRPGARVLPIGGDADET